MARLKTSSDYKIEQLRKETRMLNKELANAKDLLHFTQERLTNVLEEENTGFLYSSQRQMLINELEFTKSLLSLREANIKWEAREALKEKITYEELEQKYKALEKQIAVPSSTPAEEDTWGDQLLQARADLLTAEASLTAAANREVVYKSFYEAQIKELQERITSQANTSPKQQNTHIDKPTSEQISNYLSCLSKEELNSLLEKSAKHFKEKPQPTRGHQDSIPKLKKELARKMRAEGMSIRFIAKELSMSTTSVHRVTSVDEK